MSDRDQYLGEILYHFWGGELSEERAFGIFESIIDNGLLLSRERSRSFPKGKLSKIWIIQNARVCFTDIPEDKLADHCTDYGKWAVGFARQTIIEWGGLPVFYLPNHFDTSTFKRHASYILLGLSQSVCILDKMRKLVNGGKVTLTEDGCDLSLPDAQGKLEQIRNSILHLVSFVKEMSHADNEDYAYLYEREWRIISGTRSGKLGNPFVPLNDEQKRRLVCEHPEWGEPLKAERPEVSNQPSDEPMINSFCFFNGIPGRDTVAQKIRSIIAPDEDMVRKVNVYIEAHQDRFRDGSPSIKPYDSLKCIDKP